jgi:hypothetical protein
VPLEHAHVGVELGLRGGVLLAQALDARARGRGGRRQRGREPPQLRVRLLQVPHDRGDPLVRDLHATLLAGQRSLS